MINARTCLPAGLLLLGACSSGEIDPGQPAEGKEHIGCAVDGAKEFAPVCAVERTRQDGVLQLVIRHPVGTFRRFEVLTDGRGLAVADGADTAIVIAGGKMLDVTVGLDRYRFPFTPDTHDPKR
ncbi:MAG: hypothetical protein WCY11_17845 [Novosphingobium sp.]